jgi:lipopolysaccharide transport system permease protein
LKLDGRDVLHVSVSVTISIFNPVRLVAALVRHRYLLFQLIKRDVLLRYRGAMFGVSWMFLSPLLMIGIFAFVFGSIFRARWPQQDGGVPLWLVLYVGLIVFNVFSETVSRSPVAVRGFPSYVKKIVFPVVILPVVPLGAALAHAAFNFLILIVALASTGHLRAQILFIPLLLVPLILLSLGLAWFLAAWGVFIKDMAQVVPVFVQMLLFLSPVLYPINAVPELLRPFYQYNPLGAIIEACRAATLGFEISWDTWIVALLFGVVAAVLGYGFFQHAREEFADVL